MRRSENGCPQKYFPLSAKSSGQARTGRPFTHFSKHWTSVTYRIEQEQHPQEQKRHPLHYSTAMQSAVMMKMQHNEVRKACNIMMVLSKLDALNGPTSARSPVPIFALSLIILLGLVSTLSTTSQEKLSRWLVCVLPEGLLMICSVSLGCLSGARLLNGARSYWSMQPVLTVVPVVVFCFRSVAMPTVAILQCYTHNS